MTKVMATATNYDKSHKKGNEIMTKVIKRATKS